MKKIRIHNNIDVRWAVTTNGEDVSLEGRNLSLAIENMFGRREITDYTVDGNVVRFVFHGAEQRHTGLYVLVLQDITDGMRTVDKVQAFELVRHTIDQNGADDSNITTETVELTSDINIGYEGKSAYDVAKAKGFSGSETEWLASLKGDKGDAFRYEDFTSEQLASLKGDKGDTFTFDDLTDEQKASLKGDKGEALTFDDLTEEQKAQLKGDKGDAFSYGDFTSEQLEELRGPKGTKGDAGLPGASGVASADGVASQLDATQSYTDTELQVNVVSASIMKPALMTYDVGEVVAGATYDATKQNAIDAVPTEFRKGGMTVIYTVAGKKLSIFCTASSFSTSISEWESREVVNDLVTGGSNVPLSAEQGKLLGGRVSDNEAAIKAEVARAKAVEKVNATAISDETARAQGVESTHASALIEEVTRAKAAEATIMDSVVENRVIYDASPNGETYADCSMCLAAVDAALSAMAKKCVKQVTYMGTDGAVKQYRRKTVEWSADPDDWENMGNAGAFDDKKSRIGADTLQEAIDNIDRAKVVYDLENVVNKTVGALINPGTGEISRSGSDWPCSDYLQVTPYERLIVSGAKPGNVNTASYAFYDAAKKPVSTGNIEDSATATEITVPGDARYAVFASLGSTSSYSLSVLQRKKAMTVNGLYSRVKALEANKEDVDERLDMGWNAASGACKMVRKVYGTHENMKATDLSYMYTDKFRHVAQLKAINTYSAVSGEVYVLAGVQEPDSIYIRVVRRYKVTLSGASTDVSDKKVIINTGECVGFYGNNVIGVHDQPRYNFPKTMYYRAGSSIAGDVFTDNNPLHSSLNVQLVFDELGNYSDSSSLQDRKVAFLGDSITYGGLYTAAFATLTGCKVLNYGLNGSHLAKNVLSDTANAMEARVGSMADDADMVIVFGGTNDFGHASGTNFGFGSTPPFGSITDGANDGRLTFCAGVHRLCRNLRAKYGNRPVAIMTPLHHGTKLDTMEYVVDGDGSLHEVANADSGKTFREYVDMIKEIAAYWSIPVMDAYSESGLNPICDASKFSDGLHLNQSGADILAKWMVGKTEQIWSSV